MFKKRKWAAIVATVSDKNKRSFFNRCVLRLDEQSWRLAGGDLRGGDEVTQWTEIAFESGAGLLDDLGIESDAGELDKMFFICTGKIDEACMSFLNDVPTRLEVMQWQTEFGCENIDCANRQQAEHGGAASQTIYNFIDCAVAARRYDLLETFAHGVTRECFRFAGLRRRAYCGIAGQRFHTLAPTARFLAMGGRIENDDGVIHEART